MDTPTCACGGQEDETLEHILLQCQTFVQIYQLLISSFNQHLAFMPHIVFQIQHNSNSQLLLIHLCCLIWTTRNKKIFRNQAINLHTLNIKLWNLHKDITTLNENPPKLHQAIMCKWQPPLENFYGVNVNGSFHPSTHQASIDCVLERPS